MPNCPDCHGALRPMRFNGISVLVHSDWNNQDCKLFHQMVRENGKRLRQRIGQPSVRAK